VRQLSDIARMTETRAPLITPVLVAGCLIILISFAIRASFGVFQIPIATEFNWPRAEFSLAIAIQNLAWGIGQPIFGAIAEKFGDRRAIVLGAVTYAFGLVLSSYATLPGQHQVLELFVGFGVAGTGFGVILAMVGRAATDEHRSMTLGLATAAGSMGQVIGPPIAAYLLDFMNWSEVFIVFAVAIIAVLALLPLMRTPDMASKGDLEESMSQILGKAFRDPTFTLIFLGFFPVVINWLLSRRIFPLLYPRLPAVFPLTACWPVWGSPQHHGWALWKFRLSGRPISSARSRLVILDSAMVGNTF